MTVADLQIYAVTPIPDNIDVLQMDRVPDRIKSFYRVNNIRKFRYDRPFHKGPKDKENEFKVGLLNNVQYLSFCGMSHVDYSTQIALTRMKKVMHVGRLRKTLESGPNGLESHIQASQVCLYLGVACLLFLQYEKPYRAIIQTGQSAGTFSYKAGKGYCVPLQPRETGESS